MLTGHLSWECFSSPCAIYFKLYDFLRALIKGTWADSKAAEGAFFVWTQANRNSWWESWRSGVIERLNNDCPPVSLSLHLQELDVIPRCADPVELSRTQWNPGSISRNGSSSHVCASIPLHLPQRPPLSPLLLPPLLPPPRLSPPVMSGIGPRRLIWEKLLSQWRPLPGRWVGLICENTAV